MLKIIDHAIVQKNLTKIRDKNINRAQFRSGIIEIGRLFGYEFANTLEKEHITVETPLGTANGIKIKDIENIVVVSVLRAAIPLVEGISKVVSRRVVAFEEECMGMIYELEVDGL